jgi:NAD(P)H dehydrogenase (quinone)
VSPGGPRGLGRPPILVQESVRPATAVNVAVVYYSETGTVRALAAAAAAAADKAGADVRLRRVAPAPADGEPSAGAGGGPLAMTVHQGPQPPEATLEDLDWADVILLGSPSRFGLPAAELKQFIDTTGPLWAAGRLAGKIGSSFTASGTRHGGQESTILAMNNTFYHWGCVIVPPGYADPVQFHAGNPYGASQTSLEGTDRLTPVERVAVEFQSRRAVDVARAINFGRALLA